MVGINNNLKNNNNKTENNNNHNINISLSLPPFTPYRNRKKRTKTAPPYHHNQPQKATPPLATYPFVFALQEVHGPRALEVRQEPDGVCLDQSLIQLNVTRLALRPIPAASLGRGKEGSDKVL